jgi:magnesium-protoporphyrin O-methyltransferase
MLDPQLGSFDYVVAMDSLIHYTLPDMLDAYAALAARTRIAMAVTFAPRTPLLATLHAVGKAFPRRDRAPSIEPVAMTALLAGVATDPRLAGLTPGRTKRIESGFYKSQALELRRAVAVPA